MSRYVIIILLILTSCFTATGQNELNLFEEGNRHYEQEEFELAIESYQNLISQGYLSDDVHYNLGNSYFRINRIPDAILNYEKALKMNPSNEDAAHNLEYANTRTIDKIENPPKLFLYRWWEAFLHSFSSKSWSYFVILFLAMGVAGLGIFYFFSDSYIKKLSFYSGIVSIAIAGFCWFITDAYQESIQQSEYAIIMSPTVDINSSPSEGSSRLFVLHEGSKVKLEEKSGDWWEIKLPNGNAGWLKSSSIELI